MDQPRRTWKRLLPAPGPIRAIALPLAFVSISCVIVGFLPRKRFPGHRVVRLRRPAGRRCGVMPARPDVWLIPLLELGAVVLLGWRAIAVREDRFSWWLITCAAFILTAARPLSPPAAVRLRRSDPWSTTELGLAVHVAKVIFFLTTFLALSRMISRRVGLAAPGVRLDGFIGGCAVLTVGTALLVPDRIVYSLHGWAEFTTIVVAITALAPIALLVGLVPVLGQAPSRIWWRLIASASLAALAAAYSLLPMSVGADARSAPSWLLWTAALQALAWTAWDHWPPGRAIAQSKGRIVAPTAFALCAVGVLGADRVWPQPPIVMSLAFVCVLIAIVRMGYALRSAQRLNADHLIQRQRLREARDEALAAGRARSDLVATLSHEIRTPLTSVIGMNELLMASELNASQREQVEHVRRTGTLILDLVNDVLDLATVNEDQLTLKYQPMELAEVLGDVVELLRVNADAKRLRLRADLDPHCPEWVRGDATRLRQVLINLVGNAVKFTDVGEVTVEVCPAARLEEPEAIYFQVSDTGAGMPADQLGRLFQPYTRIQQAGSRWRPGTGLGLSISQALVRRMGGEITVTSREGVGSIFGFELVMPAEPMPKAVAGALADRRMTVVDGDPVRAETFADQLRRWGAVVTVARSNSAWWDAPADTVVIREDHPDALAALGAELERRPDVARPTLMIVTASGFAAPNRALRTRDVVVSATTTGGRLRARLISMARELDWVLPERVPDESPLRVLLAEDDPASRRICQLLIQQLGHEVDTVPDGAAAVAAAASTAYDLVLMDSQMPKLDGIDATRAIRRGEAPGEQVPIIALTGAVTEDDRESYLVAGMNGMLAKPISRADLARILDGVPRRVRSARYAHSVVAS